MNDGFFLGLGKHWETMHYLLFFACSIGALRNMRWQFWQDGYYSQLKESEGENPHQSKRVL
ncbi:hypothetical protein ABE62_11320 [Bacillus amyloliquefaciens]|nr:hypothetical protein [Bacillus amyloliquefaciens]